MKKYLILSVGLNIFILLFLVGKRIYWNSAHGPSFDRNAYMTARKEIYESLPIDSGDIVFVGNSLTDQFPLHEIFGCTRIKNRGISSNRTVDILNRIRPIAEAQPSKLFLECGINDISDNKPVQEIIRNIDSIVLMIKGTSPSTVIYIQSVLPTSKENFYLMKGVDSLNTCLADYCQSSGLNYIDLESRFTTGGAMNGRYTWDGLHLSAEGYKVWAEAIASFIQKPAKPTDLSSSF